jgi:hypothetical protein
VDTNGMVPQTITDTLRDTGGIIVSGTPANIPVKDALLCTNTPSVGGSGWRFRWHGYGHKSLCGSSTAVVVHPDPDPNDVAVQWFFAPYFDSVTKQHGVSGMYLHASGFDPSLYRTFPRQSHRFNEWSS